MSITSLRFMRAGRAQDVMVLVRIISNTDTIAHTETDDDDNAHWKSILHNKNFIIRYNFIRDLRSESKFCFELEVCDFMVRHMYAWTGVWIWFINISKTILLPFSPVARRRG